MAVQHPCNVKVVGSTPSIGSLGWMHTFEIFAHTENESCERSHRLRGAVYKSTGVVDSKNQT